MLFDILKRPWRSGLLQLLFAILLLSLLAGPGRAYYSKVRAANVKSASWERSYLSQFADDPFGIVAIGPKTFDRVWPDGAITREDFNFLKLRHFRVVPVPYLDAKDQSHMWARIRSAREGPEADWGLGDTPRRQRQHTAVLEYHVTPAVYYGKATPPDVGRTPTTMFRETAKERGDVKWVNDEKTIK